ncbi:hypothetical protein [Bacillus sp. FJAT-27445]|nr:hypothetical protein [Bacillus sp. FJAT-27445]
MGGAEPLHTTSFGMQRQGGDRLEKRKRLRDKHKTLVPAMIIPRSFP